MLTSRRGVTSLAALVALALGAGTACGSSGSAKLVATDVAEQAGAGLAKATHTHGQDCVADFNGDGIPDLLLSVHEGSWPLLRGLPDGKFEPYYKGLDPGYRDRHGCAVADFNGDGLLDVYVAIGACRGTCTAPKELWIQRPDHTFVNEAKQWGINDPDSRGRVPVVMNANGDKLPDLFAGADTPVKYPSPDHLWINKGDHFEGVTGAPTLPIGALCAAAPDINGDGYDDLAVCTPEQGFHLYRNEKGTFVDDPKSFGLDTHGLINVAFADLNGDGLPDLATITKKHVQVYLDNHGKYGKPVLSLNLTAGIDVAFGDVDGDGDPDLYVETGGTKPGLDQPDRVYLNEGKGLKWKAGPEMAPTKTGSGDTVVAIADWKGSGRAAFLVNNGFENDTGERQLWQFSGGG